MAARLVVQCMRMRRILPRLALSICLGACASDKAGGPEPEAVTIDSYNADQEAIAKAEGLKLVNYDLNRDGRADIYKFFRIVTDDPKRLGSKILVRKEVDLNHDGRVDVVKLYDVNQEVREERTDLDFDGRIDERSFYEAGKLVRQEIDLNYNGTPDVVRFFKGDRLEHLEADRNGDGRIETWEYYEGDELDRIGVDLNADGEVDRWERKRPEAPPAAAPAADNNATE